jgi:hypothetical protein
MLSQKLYCKISYPNRKIRKFRLTLHKTKQHHFKSLTSFLIGTKTMKNSKNCQLELLLIYILMYTRSVATTLLMVMTSQEIWNKLKKWKSKKEKRRELNSKIQISPKIWKKESLSESENIINYMKYKYK